MGDVKKNKIFTYAILFLSLFMLTSCKSKSENSNDKNEGEETPFSCGNASKDQCSEHKDQCGWDAIAKKCETADKIKTIYSWKELKLPDAGDDIKKFVVSGDNKNGYTLDSKGMLRHSAGMSDDWSEVLDGVMDIKPTSDGAVALHSNDNDSLYVYKQGNRNWNSDNSIKSISFFDVLDINGEETIVFAQKNKEEKIFLKRVGDNSNTHVTLDIEDANTPIVANNNPRWGRAGVAHDGGLLLVSTNANEKRIFKIAEEQIVGDATSAQVSSENGVMRSSGGKNNKGEWEQDYTAINVVGSFHDDENDQTTYFAGLDQGFATAVGKNNPDAAMMAEFNDTKEFSVYDVKQALGEWRVISSMGVLGIDDKDATYDEENNLKLSSYVQAKDNMMGDGNALNFDEEHDKALRDVFGNDDRAWFWINGDDDTKKGVYIREKTTGIPRE